MNWPKDHIFCGCPKRECCKCAKCQKIEISEGYFPPPWNIYDHPEKTEGWIAFQKALREDLSFYKWEE